MALVEMPGPGPVNKDGLSETDGSTLTSTFQNTLYEKTCKYKDYKPRPFEVITQTLLILIEKSSLASPTTLNIQTYICRLTASDKSLGRPGYEAMQIDCRCISLAVMEPSVKVYPKVIPASEGEEVTLKIQPTGLPPPSVTWSFQGKKIKSNPSIKVNEDGSLCLPCVKTEHAGTYHFTVSNCAGSVEGDIKLVLTSDQADGIVESNPVEVERFGEYVANCHANNNGRFTLEFNVSC